MLKCRLVVIVGWVGKICIDTKKGDIFLNQTNLKSNHDKVKWLVKIDFTPSPTIWLEKIHVSSTQGFFEDLTTNQSILSTVHSLLQAANLFRQLANIISMTNMSSTNDTKNTFSEILLAPNILHSKKIMKLLENVS